MEDEIKVILELSHDVQSLLDRQNVDLYQELQRRIPSIRLLHELDAPTQNGSRDIVPVLYGVAAVITSLTPVILAILKQITPPNRAKTWVVEEVETQHPDGAITIQRKQIRSTDEQRPLGFLTFTETTPSSPSVKPLPSPNKQDGQL